MGRILANSILADPALPPARRPRLAVFGGSFDPVHNGHLFVAGEVIRGGHADQVLFVPARHPPHKLNLHLAPSEHRLNMLRTALAPFAAFSVSDIELNHDAPTAFTIETMATLSQAFAEHVVLFLMGMDSFAELHKWHQAAELVNRYEMLIYPRPGVVCPAFAELAGHFGARNARRLLNCVLDISAVPMDATSIRADLAAGRSLAGLLPESVHTYIQTHALYGIRPRDTDRPGRRQEAP